MTEATAYQDSPASIASSTSPADETNSIGGTQLSQREDSDPPPSTLTKAVSAPDGASNFPPPKTDKPRPHVCGTCGRSFARLEHLKRHERSHTKEKPFECPECTRCFARRDLLLRHQQKLHLTGAPSAKSKGGRRESTSSAQSSRVRKASTASSASGGGNMAGIRPRANTISHIDGATLGMMAAATRHGTVSGDMGNPLSQHFSMARMPGNFDPHGISNTVGSLGNPLGLPRIATHGLDVGGDYGIHTAPPGPALDGSMDLDHIFSPGSTVNPAQLHLEDPMDSPASPFSKHFPRFSSGPALEEDDNFDWMRGFNTQMNFHHGNEDAMGGSSPSAMGNESPIGMNDPMLNGAAHPLASNVHLWQNSNIMASPNGESIQNHNNNGHTFTSLRNGGPTISPRSLLGKGNGDGIYTEPQQLSSMSPHSGMASLPFSIQTPLTLSSDGTSISSTSANGSGRHSSVTSTSTDSITEVTRQALLISLSQPSVFGHGQRKYSQPAVSSPLSPRDSSKAGVAGPSLPSTLDLQRYVNAYIQYFHPHFPFLHIPTLSFDAPAYTSNLRMANVSPGFGQGGIVGGGGCLILAMAAIGALYEFDRAASKELFEAAKKMIQLYLEERRKADMTSPPSTRPPADYAAQNTPLWLVQAMLLNVIYGHNCGDKIAGEIASTHCSALVSLARAADLIRQLPEPRIEDQYYQSNRGAPTNGDVHMGEGIHFHDPFNVNHAAEDEEAQWRRWIVVEERKRTLFAIFHLSSLLVSGYNHAPALMNSEIQLDLPCEEDLWAADSARAFALKGGAQGAQQGALPFAAALSTLLTASQNKTSTQAMAYHQPFGSGIPLTDLPASNLRPSTFGCLVLINALHNYIWETRQRHSGRKWTAQETESMHAHIEPALRAWQCAWAANPTHSLERPNPFGLGPLSADSIPLLDLAYVRLFVNLGASKEAFWAREFDLMAEELARGSEFVQHMEHSESATTENSGENSRNSPVSDSGATNGKLKAEGQDDSKPKTVSPAIEHQSQSSKRERHLRRAAFYAADSLSMSDKLGVTFADFTSRELPVQSALCAFDCAQVLAEWISTVQERVGRYLGVLGRDEIEYAQVPAIMLLEDEDCKLLSKVSDILSKAEAKMTYEISSMGTSAAMAASNSLPSLSNRGFGSKVLMVTAYMLERAAVWPVTSIMAQGLEIQAAHMNKRAELSTGATAS